MLTISDSMKQAYNQYTTQRKSYIKIGDSSFFVQNLNIEADCYDEGNVIGNAISKIAKFEIETEYVNQLDEFEIFDGIWTGEKYEYISLGTFKLFEEKGTDDFFSSIIAYDKLVLFNSTYDSNLVVFPTTVYGLLQSICNQANVELYNTTIANGDQPLESNLFVEGESLKHILKAICQISGCFAIISEDKLKLLLKSSDTLTLEKYQISQPEYKRTTWKINQVVLGMTDIDGEYVKYPDDTEIQGSIHKLVINDNPFVYTQELRETYIQNIYNQVNGFGYIAFEANWEGMPFVEIGDSLIIDGNESIVLRYTLKSPKGLESTLSAPSIIDSVVEYVDNSNSINNRLRKTEYTVNKHDGKITALSSRVTTEVNTLNNKINGVSASFENFKDNEYINSIANLQDQIDGAIQFWNGSEIPTIDNYPANEWITEADKNNHRADIYTVIQDIDGEMKQGKSYRFDKVGNVWQWIELTDNELSAVQAIAQESLNKVNNILNTRQSVSGNSDLYLENALEHDAVEYGIDGKSYQETRSGKNKLPNIPDITREFFGVTASAIDNEITVTGTATNGGGRLNALIYFNLPAGSYKFGLTNSVQSSVCLSNTSTGALIISSSGNYANFTLNEETQITLGVNVLPDITYNDKFKAMIVPSDVTDYTYEQYGVMPSPDYPSEIESVGIYNEETGKYEIGIKVTGKNFLNVSSQYELTGNKIIKVNIPVGDYIINWDSITTTGTDNGMLLRFHYEDGTELQKAIWLDTGKNFTSISTTQRVVEITIYSQMTWANSQNATTIFNNLMISVDGGEYEPYKEKTTTIPLSEPLRSLPNGVKDKLYVQNNKLYVERYVGSVVLDGSENWSLTTPTHDGFTRYGVPAPVIKGQNLAISSHFIVGDTTSTSVTNLLEYRNTNYIFINTDVANTLETFKTWLSTHNTQVDYELATPITEELGDISIPLFEGINNVSLIANMDTNTNITYLLKTLLSGEYFTKTETQAYVQITEDKIVSEVGTKIDGVSTTSGNQYQELLKKFDGYTPQSNFATLENSVKQIQTDTYTKTEINTKLTDGSVTKVLTTSGTFDENGMHYEKTGAKTSSTVNEKGIEVDSTTTGEELLFAGYDEEINQTIVRTENLTVRKYLVIGENSRIEDYGNGGGVFIL